AGCSATPVSGSGRLDDDPAVGALTARFRHHVGLLGQRHVNHAPLGCRHGLHLDFMPRLPHAGSGVEGALAQSFVTAALVAANVDVDPDAAPFVTVDDGVGDVLECCQGPAAAPDDLARIATEHL